MLQFLRPSFRMRWGEDVLSALAKELDRVKACDPVIVCSPSVARSDEVMSRLAEATRRRVAGVFPNVSAHSPMSTVLDAADVIRTVGADSIIAVGGGSSIVTARAANVLVSEGREISDLCTYYRGGNPVSRRLIAPKLPQIVVPTTPTTATAKAGAAVTVGRRQSRYELFDPQTRAKAILIDHTLAQTVPVEAARNAALNALCMAIEAITQHESDDVPGRFLAACVAQLNTLIPRIEEWPISSTLREQMIIYATLVGDLTDAVGGGLTQALSHTIGHRYGVHNGLIEAVLLPHVLNGHISEVADFWAKVEAAGLESDELRRAVDVLNRISGGIRLRDLEVRFGELIEVAHASTHDFAYDRTLSVDEVVAVLRASW